MTRNEYVHYGRQVVFRNVLFRPENREQTAPAFPEARFFEGRRADLHIDIGSDSIFTPNNHNC